MKNSKSKKVTKEGEYYFAKGFKELVSYVKKNHYSLVNILHDNIFPGRHIFLLHMQPHKYKAQNYIFFYLLLYSKLK